MTQIEIWRKEESTIQQNGFNHYSTKTITQLKAAGLKEFIHFNAVHSWSSGPRYRKLTEYLLNPAGHKMLSSYCEKIEQKKQFNAAGGRKTARGFKFNGEIYSSIEIALEAVEMSAARAKEAIRRRNEIRMRRNLGKAVDSIIKWRNAGCPHPVPMDSVIYVEKVKSGLSWVDFETTIKAS